MNAESFIQALAPLLKARGFKKSNATWRRGQDESVAVLNIQKSPWGSGDYYVNLGVYFFAFGELTAPTEYQCHVRRRLDVEAPQEVVDKAMAWFDARARLADAARLAQADANHGLVAWQVRAAG